MMVRIIRQMQFGIRHPEIENIFPNSLTMSCLIMVDVSKIPVNSRAHVHVNSTQVNRGERGITYVNIKLLYVKVLYLYYFKS